MQPWNQPGCIGSPSITCWKAPSPGGTVNAQHIKTVPGRKTDVKDAEWIAELLASWAAAGQLYSRSSPAGVARTDPVSHRLGPGTVRRSESPRDKCSKAPISNWPASLPILSGFPDGRCWKPSSLGAPSAPRWLTWKDGRLRKKLPALERALEGHVGPHQRFLLAQQLMHLDSLQALIERVSAEIAERLRPYEALLVRLQTIPGVGRRTAEVLVTELGGDMSRFPTAAHLGTSAGVCPGNQESAGKRASGRVRKGNGWLREVLVEAAPSAGRAKDTYLAAQYRRLTARRGRKRAALAVAHTLLVIVYHSAFAGARLC
jgi:transposase